MSSEMILHYNFDQQISISKNTYDKIWKMVNTVGLANEKFREYLENIVGEEVYEINRTLD